MLSRFLSEIAENVEFRRNLTHLAQQCSSKTDPRRHYPACCKSKGKLGVIDVATLNVIRRWALRDQMSIHEISRRTGLARNTVKKYLRSDETEPSYERRVSSSKLDPYAEKLATWLGIEATKSRKQRRTLRQIHTDSTQKGENQELIHIVSTFCSQRVWVKFDRKLGADFSAIQYKQAG